MILAIMSGNSKQASISLKCDLDEVAARRRSRAVQPGYHLDKRHWNTVTLDGSGRLRSNR